MKTLLYVALGIGAWWYFRRKPEETAPGTPIPNKERPGATIPSRPGIHNPSWMPR